MKRYHAATNERPNVALCDTFVVGDEIVTMAELYRSDGRYFDCVECHRRLSGDRRHVRPMVEEMPTL